MTKSLRYPLPPICSVSISRRSRRTQNEWKVEISGLASVRAPTSDSTRLAISLAALLVNVTARIELGATPRWSIRCAIRYVMTRVLPLPAPASISTGPVAVSTASRCWGFNCERYDKSGFLGCGVRRSIRLASAGGRRTHQPARLAVLAGAVLAQKLPRVDAVLVAVVPGEADTVLADGLNIGGPRQRLEHGQRPRHRLQRIARLPPVFLALVLAKRARAGVAQKHEAV